MAIRVKKGVRVIGGVGVVLTGIAGATYALERHLIDTWSASQRQLEDAGLVMPGDVKEYFIPLDDGGTIYALERGSGPAIVLIHGITLSSSIWLRQIEMLGANNRVIAIDVRGHGRSTAGTDTYSFDRLADDVAQVLAYCGVVEAVLVGHSMGGMIVQTLAIQRREELRKWVKELVLLSTSPGPLVPSFGGAYLPMLLSKGAERRLRRFDLHGNGILPGSDAASWAIRSCFGTKPRPEDMEFTRSIITKMSPSSMADLIRPLLSFDVHKELVTIDLPTTVVVGTRDLLTPLRMARAAANGIVGAELVELEGCGHMTMLERYSEFNTLLREISLGHAREYQSDEAC